MLTEEELLRYQRHLTLPGFGIESQEKLKNGKVLVVGAGGLGTPLLLYLAAAGVGTIGIIDPDQVDVSNLQRQVIFTTNDIDAYKVDAAAKRILALNPFIKVEKYHESLTSENALAIMKKYDLVADGSDNFPTRYLVNDAAVISGIPNVYGSVYLFEGQVSVFNYDTVQNERPVQYRDLYPEPPDPGSVPDCASGGILGVMPGIIGTIQAQEVIKILTGIGTPLAATLLLYDGLTGASKMIKLKVNKSLKPLNRLINYNQFCGIEIIPEILPETYLQWKEGGVRHLLVDVRTKEEFQAANLGGHHIALDRLEQEDKLLSTSETIVVHCQSGARSARAVQYLIKKFPEKKILNLKGGIQALKVK